MKDARIHILGSIIALLISGCALKYGGSGEAEKESVPTSSAAMTAAHASSLDEPTSPGPTLAKLDGQTFDLSHGWREATVCLVSPIDDVVECFRTKEDADTRQAEIDQIMASPDFAPQARNEDSHQPAELYCATWLHIYQHSNCSGRDLRFKRRRYEHNLTTWDFDDQMSSYNTGSCKVTFWEHVNNEGDKFVAAADGPCLNVSSGWNDEVSSLWIW